MTDSFRSRLVSAMLLASVLVLATGCSGSASDESDDASAAVAPADTHVPVKVARVRREDLDVTVTAEGRTEALRSDRIRAPFASRLTSLRVTDGDKVTRGEVIAVIVARDSQAALDGAKQMLAAAHTPRDQADARRAVTLAERNLVRQSLTAPANGVVVSHGAESGDYVDANEVLVTIAETATVYFNAQVAQSDASKVRAGQLATIDLPALGTKSVNAVVKGLLPVASSANFTVPVRLDFPVGASNVPMGLFGTASIVIARHAGATVVPAAAVLRDDVTGEKRVAIIGSSELAHWLTVDTGVREGNSVEILHPAIADGARVIIDGQVGLPEGARVVIE